VNFKLLHPLPDMMHQYCGGSVLLRTDQQTVTCLTTVKMIMMTNAWSQALNDIS